MPTPRTPRLTLRLAACAVAAATAARAEVFMRVPRSADAALQQLGGTCAYATEAALNGAPGQLSVYAFPSASATEVRAGLTKTLKLPAAPPSFGGALITRAEKGRVDRIFVLPAASGESACVALLFDQSSSDAARAGQHPVEWPPELPALAATPLFAASCAQTRTTFATAETAAAPEAALAEAAALLQRSGWQRMGANGCATFALFASGRKTCLLFSSRNPTTGRTTISVLQREGATQ